MTKHLSKDEIEAWLDHHPSIHKSGSVVGMRKRGYWGKDDVVIRYGNYYYNLSIWLD